MAASSESILTASPFPEQSASPFSWIDKWYAIAMTDNIDAGEIHPFALFDRSYIIYLDAVTNVYVVTENACPHRAAPLSEGRLFERETPEGRQTVLECAYHGWRFGCNGKCLDIPNAPQEFSIPEAANISRVFATSVSSVGVVFMWLGDPLKADEKLLPYPNAIATAMASPETPLDTFFRTYPVSLTSATENLIDPAHVAWVHHGIQIYDRRNVSRTSPFQVTERNMDAGTFRADHKGTMGKFPLTTLLHEGNTVQFSFSAPGETETFAGLVWLTPVGRYETLVHTVTPKFPPKGIMGFVIGRRPVWMSHCIANAIMDGDAVMQQGQEAGLRESGKEWNKVFMMGGTKWDGLVLAFRRWMDTYGSRMPFVLDGSDAPKRMSHDDVNDRFRWHTIDCKFCSKALRRMRLLRSALMGISVMIASTVLLCVVLTLGLRSSSYSFVARNLRIAIAGMLATTLAIGALILLLSKGIKSLTCTNFAKHLRVADDTAF